MADTMMIKKACEGLNRRKWRGRDDWHVGKINSFYVFSEPRTQPAMSYRSADAIALANGLRAEERVAELEAELAAALTLLTPNCTEETLQGAIRNLQQAHISERDNVVAFEQQRRDTPTVPVEPSEAATERKAILEIGEQLLTKFDNSDDVHAAYGVRTLMQRIRWRGENERRETMNAIDLIRQERERQQSVEGWTREHDSEHDGGELAMAAACYAAPEPVYIHREAEIGALVNSGDRGDRRLRRAGYYHAWPWDEEWDKRNKHDRQRQLVIAGALIVAELDRLAVALPEQEQSPQPATGADLEV